MPRPPARHCLPVHQSVGDACRHMLNSGESRDLWELSLFTLSIPCQLFFGLCLPRSMYIKHSLVWFFCIGWDISHFQVLLLFGILHCYKELLTN